jgi:hypothetical protein
MAVWFILGRKPRPPVSSTNKTHRHDITEILFKVALSIIKPTNQKCRHITPPLAPLMISVFLLVDETGVPGEPPTCR